MADRNKNLSGGSVIADVQTDDNSQLIKSITEWILEA